MKSSVKIYTGNCFGALAPAANRVTAFRISDLHKALSLNSILLDVLIRVQPGFTPVPWEQNNFLNVLLTCFPNAIAQPASAHAFEFTGINPFDWTGREIMITKPGQVFFKEFYAEDEINFNLDVENVDLLQTYFYNISIVAEIEQGKWI